MRMTAEQIKNYLEQRLQNIIHNEETTKNKKYTYQKEELQDILKSIR